MSTDTPPQGWIVHSKGRKFGPLTEDEVRGYFRAGMVQSVDRLTAPGDFAMRAAGEVALMLGETPPAGPPPEALDAPPAPVTPTRAAAAPPDPDREERVARAMAVMNVQFETLAASSSSRGKRNRWLLPVLMGIALIVLLVVGLRMLGNMKPGARPLHADNARVPAAVASARVLPA